MSYFFDTQGGFEGPPPTNHKAPTAGEGTMNPVPRRTIGEILAMENNGYSFNDWSNNSYNDRPYYDNSSNDWSINDHSYHDMSYNDNSYNDWSNNDYSYNDMSYNVWSYNESTTHEECNISADQFKELKEMMQQHMERRDQSMRDFQVELKKGFKEISEKFEDTLVRLFNVRNRIDEIDKQMELMPDETRETHEPEKVMELVQPNQLEGTNDFSLETHDFEDIKLSCIKQEPSSHLIPIDTYYELFCESPKKNFQTEVSMIGENEDDQLKENSFIDFIFPPNAFDPPEHSSIKLHFMMYSTFVVNFIAKFVANLPWAIVCVLAHIIHCVNRRRTKGPLAQPFDTCD